uniref:RH64087p n=1 Tax=Drosophila melanogaster TaxID=7227 RepID=Q5U1D7_DROME|nr:RH64087p [Drosophila melanogaster]
MIFEGYSSLGRPKETRIMREYLREVCSVLTQDKQGNEWHIHSVIFSVLNLN